MTYDPPLHCNCPDCTAKRDLPCEHNHASPPPPCCDTLLGDLDFSLPLATVLQCPDCRRLWEWCGIVDGRGVALLVDPDLEFDDDGGGGIPEC